MGRLKAVSPSKRTAYVLLRRVCFNVRQGKFLHKDSLEESDKFISFTP